MPIGLQRFNTKKSQPNPCIVFIRALKGPDEEAAQGFLERIAAQCVPIMRDNSLSVMTVEEFPPNREFVGRNFNAGEVIQLVLKAPGGRWLPFRYVQMVMMHELAHCKQMNHSRAFWAVRNAYAAQMQALWGKGYTGEGIWGRGAALGTGRWEDGLDTVREGDMLPEHLCGGTYRTSTRRPKRKRPVLTYKERKERRILKKFGEGGTVLGADEEVKERLEGKGKGKAKAKAKGRPRVAGSARGRELRAAAALARFEQSKKDAAKKEKEEEDEEEEEVDTGSEFEGDEEGGFEEEEAAIDVDGKRLVDGSGRGLVRVCEGEDYDADGSGVQGELEQLRTMLAGRSLQREAGGAETEWKDAQRSRSKAEIAEAKIEGTPIPPQRRPSLRARGSNGVGSRDSISDRGSISTEKKEKPKKPRLRSIDLTGADTTGSSAAEASSSRSRTETQRETEQETQREMEGKREPRNSTSCSMCSLENPEGSMTCGACGNVLDGAGMPNAWRCGGSPCRETGYLNAGDCGVCGLCGRRRGA